MRNSVLSWATQVKYANLFFGNRENQAISSTTWSLEQGLSDRNGELLIFGSKCEVVGLAFKSVDYFSVSG